MSLQSQYTGIEGKTFNFAAQKLDIMFRHFLESPVHFLVVKRQNKDTKASVAFTLPHSLP